MTTADPVRPAPFALVVGVTLVPLGDDDAGTCTDGVCAVPAAAEAPRAEPGAR